MGGHPADAEGGGPAARWRRVLAAWRPSADRLTDAAVTAAFERALRRLLAADGAGVGASASVVACHGAGNATTHALTAVAIAAPVFHAAGDADAAAAIARSGHQPVAVPPGALIHRARRSPRCGLVLGRPDRATGADWDALRAIAGRCVVVLDASGGGVTSRPLGAYVDAGGVAVGSLDVRLRAPGLHVGWLIATGEAAALARESVMCESGGVAPLLLDLAARAMEAAIADAAHPSLLMRL